MVALRQGLQLHGPNAARNAFLQTVFFCSIVAPRMGDKVAVHPLGQQRFNVRVGQAIGEFSQIVGYGQGADCLGSKALGNVLPPRGIFMLVRNPYSSWSGQQAVRVGGCHKRYCSTHKKAMVESSQLFPPPMNALSEMYPVFESPFPTLLTHTDTGLGIFVAHPKVALAVKNIGPDADMFRVVAGALDFFFPLKEHARTLLANRGGVIAFTDESGMPWYTLEMAPTLVPNLQSTPVAAARPRGQFGRPQRPAPAVSPLSDEGEFSL